MNKIYQWLTGDLFKAVGGVVDEVFTNDEERAEGKRKILEVVTAMSIELMQLQASIILAEAKGNWLQRSWRPILMLAFGFIVIYSKFLAPAFGLQNTELEPEFWDLLRLGIGGYVVGRSAEKIVSNVFSGIDIKQILNKKQ